LYLAHSMVHVPLFVSERFRGKSGRGLFGDVMMEVDWSVGEVLGALKAHGLEGETLVIFASDNGPWLSYGDHAGSAAPLREGKGTSWEGGTRVPCVMRWPGRIPAGSTSNAMVMTIDLLPTVAALAGARLPEAKIDGLDVWPLLSGDGPNPHEFYAFYYETNQLQAITSGDGRWKLQLPHSYRTLDGPAGSGGRPSRYRQVKIDQPELYDLENDVGESRNVASSHPEIVSRLTAFAERVRDDLGDAITGREGRGVRPAGVEP
jgi:arylsulfatase